MVLVSHFTHRFAVNCLIGNNPVSILATLILLSEYKDPYIDYCSSYYFSRGNSARLIPIMNSCHASYKAKHHYWPGSLLLVVHLVVLLVFVFHPQQDLSITLLVILVGTGILHIWACVSGGVDTNWYLDVLEGSELNHFSCLNHDQLLRKRWLAVGLIFLHSTTAI